MLVCLFLSIAVFPNVLAVPVTFQDAAVTWASESLQPLRQHTLDFLNPFHTPSTTQATISCFLLIFLSAITAGPRMAPHREGVTRLQAFFQRLDCFIYGLMAPDVYAITSWFGRIGEACVALIYDRCFNKDAPKKYKWTAIHGAFIMRGGFVLWEDNKPVKVLGLADLLRMVNSAEVELPPLSQEDILSRSTRAPGRIAFLLLILPHYWFARKFIPALPLLSILAVMHGTLSWYAYFWRSSTITGVVEPVVVIRRPQELKEKLISKDSTVDVEKAEPHSPDELDGLLGPVASDDPGSACSSEKTSEPLDAPDAPEDEPRTSLLMNFLAIVCSFLVEVFFLLMKILMATTSPMRVQWRTISKPWNMTTLGCYIAGTIVTLIGWISFFSSTNKCPFPSELEREIWRAASLFILAQPVILLLAPRWVRSRLWGSVKRLIWVVYTSAYAGARLSIFVIALRSINMVV